MFSIDISSSSITELKTLISQSKRNKEELEFAYKSIENKTEITVFHFYIIMLLFGYFMEIKLANASFWIAYESSKGHKKEVEQKKEELLLTEKRVVTATNMNLFSTADALKAIQKKKAITLYDATLYAVIRCAFSDGLTLDNMTSSLVQQNMLSINPKTNKPFLAKRWQKKIRDNLKTMNFDDNKFKHGFIEKIISKQQ